MPIEITDKLSRIPTNALQLLASKDPASRMELFRRRLGALCWHRLQLVDEKRKQLWNLKRASTPQERREIQTLINKLDKELNR